MAECSTQKTAVETLLRRIQMEDKNIQEDIKTIMTVLMVMSQSQVTMDILKIQLQQKIRNIQMKNRREFIRKARSKYEKLRNKPKEIMGMLEETMTHMSTLEEILCGQIELNYDLLSFKEEIQEELLHFEQELQEKFKNKVVEVPDELHSRACEEGMKLLDNFDSKVMELKDECYGKVLELENRLDEMDYRLQYKEDVVQPKQVVRSVIDKVRSKQQEIRSILDEVKSKQQEVRSILDMVKRKLQISVTSSFPIKVLCWNINGSGITEARNCLVPAVVRAESPDVLLLQEKTSDVIVRLCQKFKNYGVVETIPVGEKKLVESLILYDQNKYELLVQYREKLSSSGPILGDVMYRSINKVVPNTTWQLKDGKIQKLRNIFYDRMIIVCLKRRGFTKSPIMIFISFHNIYKVKDCYVRESARLFCQIVLEIQRRTRCVVVAGADLNHQLSTRYCTELGATLMQYEVTERRSEGLKVDYCIVAPASTAEEASIKALNFIDTEESDSLHSLMSRLMKTKYKYTDYKEALDHDPLMCELTIYVSEDENESESESETSEDD